MKKPQGAVQLRPVGGFQSTPFGLFDLGAAAPTQAPNEQAPGIALVAPEAQPVATPVHRPPLAGPIAVHRGSKSAPAPATNPRAVIAAAKARVKEIRAELKNKRALERELAELERLLKAAREKPKSTVRALRSA